MGTLEATAARCLAFPVTYYQLSRALDYFRQVIGVSSAYFFPHCNMCLCHVEPSTEPASLTAALKRFQTRKWHRWAANTNDDAALPPMRALGREFTDFASHRLEHRQRCSFSQLKREYRLGVVDSSWIQRPYRIMARLHRARDLSHQMVLLHEALCLRTPQALLCMTYMTSLRDLLIASSPGTQLHVFGSLVNGLGSCSSDVDAVISPGQPVEDPAAVPQFAQVVRIDENGSPVMGTSDLKRFILGVDGARPPCFVIESARVAICHVKHPSLGVQIDFSFDGASSANCGRQMSHFIRRLVESGRCPELAPLIFAVKFMGSERELIGPLGYRWTGFKLLVLVMHFLQARGLLPPLDELLMDGEVEFRNQDKVKQVASTTNRSELSVLLCEFFSYYAEMHLTTKSDNPIVFCLRRGHRVSDVGDLEEAGRRFPKSVLVVKEPFLSEVNVMNNITGKKWNSFADFCAQMVDLLQQERPTEVSQLPWGILSCLKGERLDKFTHEVFATLKRDGSRQKAP